MNRANRIGLVGCCLLCWFSSPLGAEAPQLGFQQKDGELRISIGGQHIGDYVWHDEQIRRPYFRHLKTRSGLQVTRTLPPEKGKDIDDHPTMHPGLWLAFGDLGGVDFWRNKGVVRHVEFLKQPASTPNGGLFEVKNAYEFEGREICTEKCQIVIKTHPRGYVISWDSQFLARDTAFSFGDQEEMGLGVRVATPLAVVKGGSIIDSNGRKNGAEVWGKQAAWCEYTGVLEGKRVGVVIMPDPGNFRQSWFHARDYGLLVANPFGQQAFTKGAASQIPVAANSDLRLKFHVLVYGTAPDDPVDVGKVYSELFKPMR